MKTTLLAAAAAALSLITATAQAASGGAAGVGDGNPFPYRVPGITSVSPPAYAATGSIAYDLTGRPSQVVTLGGPNGVPMTGSQGGVETANSLPRGFQEGTVAYAQERSVQRYLAQQAAAAPTRLAQTAQAPGGKPRSSGSVTQLAAVGNRHGISSPRQQQSFDRDYTSPAGISCGLLCRAGIQ